MPRRLLLNSAMIKNPGRYDYNVISQDEAVAWMQVGAFESYCGYPDNAAYLSRISGINVPVNRGECAMNPGDEALVM